MQAQAVRPAATKAAPVKEVTATHSLSLMKNLVRASISEVCYLRNLFPSDCFRASAFGNTTIRALVPRELDAEGKPTGPIINMDAARVVAWEDAAFEALSEGYLRALVLSIYSAEDDPADRELLVRGWEGRGWGGRGASQSKRRCGDWRRGLPGTAQPTRRASPPSLDRSPTSNPFATRGTTRLR